MALFQFIEACNELSMNNSSNELSEFMCSDASGDGELDFDEFCKFYAAHLRKVFDEIDTDRSGEIDPLELQMAFQELGYKATKREVWGLLAELDTDSNNGISFLEFSNYFCSMPSPSMKAVMVKWALGLSIDIIAGCSTALLILQVQT